MSDELTGYLEARSAYLTTADPRERDAANAMDYLRDQMNAADLAWLDARPPLLLSDCG